MPSFHTKTIASILDPVAQQVSKLIVLHEEAEDGNAMPDLQRPVGVVKLAVQNLVKVGYETINSSDDQILKQDMPPSLTRVEDASNDLQGAADMLNRDTFSVPARKKLIDGSRGILQGTSSLLVTFDSSEVRKIIRQCKSVLDVLAIVEVVDRMDQLVEFVKGLSPCLSRMAQEVDSREKELTIQSHSEMLARSLEKVKALTPILISSIKMFITTSDQGNSEGAMASQCNRDYVVMHMSNEIQEMIRVLQLTTAEDTEWYDDDLAVMRTSLATMDNRMPFAHDWISNPNGLVGSAGDKALKEMASEARKLASLCAIPEDKLAIERSADEIDAHVSQLADFRLKQEGSSPQAQNLASQCLTKLGRLRSVCEEAATHAERHGVFRPARTLEGKLSQAQRWLSHPTGPQRQTGLEACRLLSSEGRRLVEVLPVGQEGDGARQMDRLCNAVDQAATRLDLLTQHQGPTSPTTNREVQELALSLSQALTSLRDRLHLGLVERVAENFIDVHGPLRLMVEAANAPRDLVNRDEIFEKKAELFQDYSDRMCLTADLVAANTPDLQLAESLRCLVGEVSGLGSQMAEAGRLSLYGEGHQQQAADHLDLVKRHWTERVDRMRCFVDEATDTNAFIRAQEAGIHRDTESTEKSIQSASTSGVVDFTSNIARRANRVLQVANQEAANSEDAPYVDRVNDAVKQLRATITPMVIEAKGLVSNMSDSGAVTKWRESNRSLISAVSGVREAVTPQMIPPPRMQRGVHPPGATSTVNEKPIRDRAVGAALAQQTNRGSPTLPTDEMARMDLDDARSSTLQPSRARPETPDTETDVEDDFDFPEPQDNQPILAAAHALHQEAKQWCSRDNEIISAAKRMASLMAKLSQIVRSPEENGDAVKRGECGTKKDLIDVAKAIADSSEDVTRCAKILARECTDKRMRTNLLQVCERIPTIGTQLKILSTVKATMLGTQGSDEDQEATEMLVGNAQNLMQSVVDTVHAAESATIKMRVDTGVRIRWVRHTPWYHT